MNKPGLKPMSQRNVSPANKKQAGAMDRISAPPTPTPLKGSTNVGGRSANYKSKVGVARKPKTLGGKP